MNPKYSPPHGYAGIQERVEKIILKHNGLHAFAVRAAITDLSGLVMEYFHEGCSTGFRDGYQTKEAEKEVLE